MQIVDEGSIPVTENDVPVDALVSPAGVIPITSAALDRYVQVNPPILLLFRWILIFFPLHNSLSKCRLKD